MTITEDGAGLVLCEVEKRWSRGWAGGFIYVEAVPCRLILSEDHALSSVLHKVIGMNEVLRDTEM